jgi:hypothetical protein
LLDPQGRQVLLRPTGQFLLVVEAAPGSSGRQPGSEGVFTGGTVDPIVHASGSPSLQMLVQNDIGDGSALIDCRSNPVGGVEGHPALDFTADVNQSLIDMACRFEMVSQPTLACTRDRFGNFGFIDSTSTRQYCFQIPVAAHFDDGDNIVAIQFRDTSGNLGPRKEFVVRIDQTILSGETTPTPTPTPTPAIASISGRLRYFSADRPVPTATVRLTGAALLTSVSNVTGNFAFNNMMPGTVTFEPRKTGDFGSPSAITALDAAWVLQGIAGVRVLDSRQRLACDVTGNGSLSALDATRILQRQVGLLPRFAVADNCASDWVFEPVPGPAANQRLIQPLMSGTTCRRGAIALEPMVGTITQQNFYSMLFGDCTGNWQPSGAPALRAQAAGDHVVRLRIPRFTRAGVVRAPITVEGSESYSAVDMRLRYDARAVRAVAVRPLRAAMGTLFVANLTRPGEVRIAVAAGNPIPVRVPLVAVEFEGIPAEGSVSFTYAAVDDLRAATDP